MQTIDIILGIFLLIFFFNGFRKGIISSIVGLIGLLAVIYLIATFGNATKLYIIENLGTNEILGTILSYIAIAIVIAIIFRMVVFILHRIVDALNLGMINRILGGAFGILSGAIIIAILLMICDISPYYKDIRKFTSESVIVNHVRVATTKIQKDYPKFRVPKKEKKKAKASIEKIKDDVLEEMDKSKDQMEDFIEEKTK
jgi:membrane protein required for colicin V production